MQKSVDVLVMAAGSGTRFGSRKQFVDFGGRPVLAAACSIFKELDSPGRIIVVYPPDMDEGEVRKNGGISGDIVLVKGAVKRCDSVRAGLAEVRSEFVLIHDAVRPACSAGLASSVLKAALVYDAAVPAVNPVETVKYMDAGVLETLDRKNVYLIQTPQGFRSSSIIEAYKHTKDADPTDSSSVAQEYGLEVVLVEGERTNIKITVQADYDYLLNMVNTEG